MEFVADNSNRRTFSTALPALLIVVGASSITPPYTVHNDIAPENVLIGSNNMPFFRADLPPMIYVTDLESAKYELAQPAAVTLQESDGEYVISFPDADLVTSGDTPGEALRWLKESIVSTYELFSAQRSSLGPLPKRQLQALERYVAKKQVRAA